MEVLHCCRHQLRSCDAGKHRSLHAIGHSHRRHSIVEQSPSIEPRNDLRRGIPKPPARSTSVPRLDTDGRDSAAIR